MTTDKYQGIRVMQLLVGEAWGGAERFFVKLAGALHKRGLDQKIVILRDPKRAQDLRDLGLEPVELDFAKGLKDVFARRELARVTKAYQPDVAVAWMNRAARRMPKGPFVKVGRLGGYYPLKYYKKCDWLIGNTPDLERYIKAEGWPENRVKMLSNFGEMQPLPAVDRATLATPDDAFVILSLGRLHPSKGFDTLIEAMTHVPGAVLWLAGTGELEGDLRQIAKTAGVSDRVRFLGWRDDQAALLQAADLCVVPSRHEPLSNVTLEAWSVAKPVVATASEGPSWLIDHGVTGLLTPVDNAAELGKAILAMRDDPAMARRLADQGHAKWQAEFSEEAVCDQFIDFFQGIRTPRA